MSEWIDILLFGILQGLTEFLPVSSSGHLSLFQYFSSAMEDNLTMNVAVHVGTLGTILYYYRQDLFQLTRGLLKKDSESLNMLKLLIVASVPTALLGVAMKKNIAWALTHPLVAAFGLLTTGFILFFSNRIKTAKSSESGFGMGVRQALVVGTVQGFAVLPGISRSGSTIIMAMALGVSPKNASRFSFLVSIPAIVGASLLELVDTSEALDYSQLAAGAVVSFVVGLWAISWMVKLTLSGRLKMFAYYTMTLSLAFSLCYFMGLGKDIF